MEIVIVVAVLVALGIGFLVGKAIYQKAAALNTNRI